MVGIGSVITILNLAQACNQLGLVQVTVADEARGLYEVENKHGQAISWRGFGKAEYVKLPVVFSILHTTSHMPT